MCRESNQSALTPEKFELPVAIELSSENRWVVMAELIPWPEFEEEYAENFSEKKIDQDLVNKVNQKMVDSIAIIFLVINLSTMLRQINCLFLSLSTPTKKNGQSLAQPL